ncbi:MAG: hypothetical protein HZA15_15930 [Nitrospirae bacterium]|nr:hypothetical protein [Nitrospirota bacterium]
MKGGRMTMHGKRALRAFIAAPVHQDLETLTTELRKRDIIVFTAYDLSPVTTSLVANIEKAIQQADLIVAVVPAQMSPNVFFELGIAHALHKPIILLVSPKYGQLPSDLAGTFYLRADSENREAIGFALDQCLSRIEKSVEQPTKATREGRPLGADADKFLDRINREGPSMRGRELENLVAEVLRTSGVDTMMQSPKPNQGADIAVWSDALQPVTGNPLLIEVKSSIRTKQQLLGALNQVEQYRINSGARLSLLVVMTSLVDLSSVPSISGILAVSFNELVNQLRNKTFAETIRELRNQYAHGGKK